MNVEVFDSIRRVGQTTWDRLAADAFPFASYHFLDALETSDCLGARTGWYPAYLVAKDRDRTTGALVAYVRTNSWGEYVFDFAWADGARAAGLEYYPKLTSAIPFTPATGSKILLDPGLDTANRASVAQALRRALGDLAHRLGASSSHALFLPENEIDAWRSAGFDIRDGLSIPLVQPRGFTDFENFLSSLKGKRRREIRRERAQVAAAGITMRRLTGADLTPAWADTFHEFYLGTIDKRASFDYLTGAFFREIFKNFAARTLLVVAEDAGGRPVAGGAQLLRRARPLRTPVGLPGRTPRVALRMLLLPRAGVRDRTRVAPVRGGRAGRTQTAAWLSAHGHPQRAPGARSRIGPRGAGVPDPGVGARRHRSRGLGRALAICRTQSVDDRVCSNARGV